MSNLSLWEKVQSVDVKATKQANVDGNKQTSINTLYPIKQFTKEMGPIGKLWRYEINEERLDNTKPMVIGGKQVTDSNGLVWEQTHTLILNFYIRYSES